MPELARVSDGGDHTPPSCILIPLEPEEGLEMSALSFSVVRRRVPRMLAGAVFGGAVGATMWACSGGETASPQAANAPIGVQTSQLFVTVENKAGLALIDVEVAILPVGSPAIYTKFVDRLENGEKRDVSLGDFNGRDGTPFSLRVVRPKTVRVKAKDMVGKTYETAVPW